MLIIRAYRMILVSLGDQTKCRKIHNFPTTSNDNGSDHVFLVRNFHTEISPI